MRKFLRIVLLGLVSSLVIISAAALLLTSPPGENLLKGWIENQLTTQIGLPVSIDRFETNLWSHVLIDTLVVASPTGEEGWPTLFVGQIRVDYSIPELLGEVVTLRALSVDSAAIVMTLDSLGHYGIPALDATASVIEGADNESVAIRVDSVSLVRAGLSHFDRNIPYSVELSEVALSAQGKPDGSFAGKLSVGDVIAAYGNQALNFHNLELAASINHNELQVDKVSVECDGLVLKANGDLGLGHPNDLSFAVTIDGPLDTLASSAAESFDLLTFRGGHTSVRCHIEGNLDYPILELGADFSDLVFQDITVPSAVFRAKYHDNQVLVDTVLVSALGGTISGKVDMMLDTPGSASLSVTMDRIDLSTLWQAIYAESSPYQGTVSGQISAQGQSQELASWTVDAHVAGDSLRYLNRPVPEFTCTARIESGRTSLSLIHGTDEISADVEFGKDSLQGSFTCSVPDITALSRFLDEPDISGSLLAQGTMEGAYSNPSLHSTVHGAGITYRDFPVDSAVATLSYADSVLTVIDLWCTGTLDSIDSEYPPFGLDSASGSIAYEGRLSGPTDSLSGDLTAFLNEPRYGSYAADSLSLEARLSGSTFAITELKASRGDLGAMLSATFDTSAASGAFDLKLLPLSAQPDSFREQTQSATNARNDFGSINGEFALGSHSSLSATVHGQGIWLGLLSMFTRDTTLTDGDISFDLAVDGPYLTPSAVLDATARSVKISDYLIDSVTTHAELSNNSLILGNLTSYASGHKLEASGWLGLGISKDGMFELADSALISAELSTTDFDLSLLADLILPYGDVSGIASTALRVDGTIATPRIDGWLTVRNGRLLLQDGSLPLDNIAVSLRFADSLFTIDSARATVMDRSIVASGLLIATAPFESALVDFDLSVGQLGRLAIDGMVSDSVVRIEVLSDSLNLAVFQPFVTEVDSLRGRLGCRLAIGGIASAPQIDGYLQINAVSFQLPRHHVSLADGHAAVRFDSGRVLLDSVLCSINGGWLAVSGIIAHDRGTLQDIALTLQAHNIMMEEPGSYIVNVDSAALRYGRQQENYVLDGDIVLGEARLMAGLRPTSILPWVQSIETVDLELPELIGRSRLDVRVLGSDELWIDNNLARIRLRAEIGVIGTPLRPNFTGLVQVEEGYLLYLDRRFSVNEGVVFFNDPSRFNPDINLEASTEVTVYRRTAAEPYTVFIKADGLLDQLQYGLYSEPPLDKPDIVALLTLGATRTELAGNNGNGGSGLTEVLKDRAAMLTSRRVSGYLSRKAGSFFGFDEFTIQGNLFQFDNTWGPQLVASKRLSQRVDFTYSTTVGHLNDQAVRLGYHLTPRFSLQGETDRQGRSGLDLRYGFTYK